MSQLITEKYCSKLVTESTCKADHHTKIRTELRHGINAKAGRDR